MEAPKRFKIPTLDEMETVVSEKTPESLFKRRKELTSDNPSPVKTLAAATNNSVSNVSFTTTVKTRDSTQLSNVSQTATRPLLPLAASTPQEASSSKIFPHQKDSHVSVKDKATKEVQPENTHDVDTATEGSVTVSRPGSSKSLIVNPRQRGNPILKSIRNVPWEYGHIVPDYVMGPANCALFLSLRYHQLHPNYLHERLKLLGRSYDLRIMLVLVDVKESHHILKDLAKICLLADCTLVLAFSPEEAARYLETYKIFENKPPEAIMEKTEENFMAKFTDCLTRVKSVNRTDCATLLSHFGSLTGIIEASSEDLSLCPGFGPQKAKRLHSIFHEPFIRSRTADKPNKCGK
ncbi:unnamed protein product [Candidula unifasciata]|uniref:DNA excision repair protein ERCC-1 n=1 Tax=Candidula unifasciata TaxID=100452 RepID=A0A8S3YUI6_9EUPU|nr:unnamed protein product [Candidula unifasciata]